MKILSSLLFAFSFLFATIAYADEDCAALIGTGSAEDMAAMNACNERINGAAAAVAKTPVASASTVAIPANQADFEAQKAALRTPRSFGSGEVSEEDARESAATGYTKSGTEYVPRTYGGCFDKLEEASDTCDPKKNENILNTVSMSKGVVTGLGTMQGACSDLSKLAGAMNMATAGFSGFCSTDYLKCNSECSDNISDVSEDLEQLHIDYANLYKITTTPAGFPKLYEMEDKIKANELAKAKLRKQNNICSSYSRHVNDAAQSVLMMTGVQMQMAQCQKATGLDCKKTPTNPICIMLGQGGSLADCSTAAGQSNPVCICQRNPSAPQCASGSDGSYNSGIGSGGMAADGGNLALSPFGGPGGLGGDTGMFPAGAVPGEAGAGAGGSLSKGGSGRGGAQESGGGNNGRGGAPGGGPGGSGINTKIIGGYGVGGGSGGGGGSYGSGGSGSVGGYGGRPGAPNLRQFLPGGKMDPSRAIAGETGPDGITGPNTDIWKKVKTRYYAKKPSLLP